MEPTRWYRSSGSGAVEQHAIIGMVDGTVTEFHWSPASTGMVYHDDLFNLPGMSMISAFRDAGGTQHAIVGTTSDDVHELWWGGSPVIHRPSPPLPGHGPPTRAPSRWPVRAAEDTGGGAGIHQHDGADASVTGHAGHIGGVELLGEQGSGAGQRRTVRGAARPASRRDGRPRHRQR
jgi:hypothetical protein